MDDYTVIVSRRADEILIRHARFLAQVRVSAARQMTAECAKVIDALEKNPFQFPPELDYNLPDGAYRKALFSKWYKAIFSVAENTVYLDAVLDCRQDNRGYQPDTNSRGQLPIDE